MVEVQLKNTNPDFDHPSCIGPQRYFPTQVAIKRHLIGSEITLDPCFQRSDPRAAVCLFCYVCQVSYSCGHIWTLGRIVSEVLIPTRRSLILCIIVL